MKQQQQIDVTEQLWRELSDRLRQFVRLRIKSDSDVDDVLQSVFLRVHSRIGDLRDSQRLQSWIFQITRNAISDFFRQRSANHHDIEAVQPESEVESNTELAEVGNCLESFLACLPDDQKRAVTMYEYDGLSQQEIADRESVSLSGAKSRIQRGRKALAAMLAQCCEFELDRCGNIIEYRPTATDCCGNDCR